MIFISIEAHPKPDSDAYGEISGAQAACWIDTDDTAIAEYRVRDTLAGTGWDTDSIEEARLVTRDQYLDAPESLQRFEQALVDGIVITLHTWPVGAPDE